MPYLQYTNFSILGLTCNDKSPKLFVLKLATWNVRIKGISRILRLVCFVPFPKQTKKNNNPMTAT